MATVHALGWLVVACGIGMLLSVLLVAPDLGRVFGPLTYGRWTPLHLNLVLYGWLALPLIALLFQAFGVARGSVAVQVWSGSLMFGAVAWLAGETTGKAFLDWTGVARWAFLISQLVLAGVLATGLRGRKARGLWVLWVGLLAVPVALWFATSPSTYPPVNPDTGGPTGASLLGSTLCVIAMFAGTPLLLGLKRGGEAGREAWEVFGALGVHSLFFLGVGMDDRSHREPLQIAAVASLLVWAWLLPRWLRRFEWPDGSRPWLLAFLAWGGALLATAVPMFLPGVLDRIKFTNALVGHAHLAMAGMASSFAALVLVVVNDRTRLRGCLGDRGSFLLWHGGNVLHVAALAAAGWIEAVDPGAVFRGERAIAVCYLVRVLAGAAVLAAALRWVGEALRVLTPCPPLPSPAPAFGRPRRERGDATGSTPLRFCSSAPARSPLSRRGRPKAGAGDGRGGQGVRFQAPTLFCLFAGLGDAATGILLVAAPGLVLRLLGIGPVADDALLRFVGVFVGCVGLAYLYPLVLRGRGRLRTAIEITAGVRLAVAAFLAVAVLRGIMDEAWIPVGGYDALVAAAQLALLARGFFDGF